MAKSSLIMHTNCVKWTCTPLALLRRVYNIAILLANSEVTVMARVMVSQLVRQISSSKLPL